MLETGLEQARRSLVQLGTTTGRLDVEQCLADQRVHEPVALLIVDDEPGLDRLAERARNISGGRRAQRREQVEVEVVTHRRRGQDRVGRFAETRQASSDHLTHPVRDGRGDRPGTAAEKTRALLEEQRVAAGSGVQLLDELRRRRVSEDVADDFPGRYHVEPAQGQPQDIGRERRQHVGQRWSHLRRVVARTEGQCDPQPRRGSGEERPQRAEAAAHY